MQMENIKFYATNFTEICIKKLFYKIHVIQNFKHLLVWLHVHLTLEFNAKNTILQNNEHIVSLFLRRKITEVDYS